MVKTDKYPKKSINSTANNSNSLFKLNNRVKSKNKQVTNSKYSHINKIKNVIKDNFLIKSYNNKYLNLFKSTQNKNNNLLFTNKIDKTNLNKKFEEIAHKVTKINKNNNKDKKNIVEEKKIPLWKYIQSDLRQINPNNKKDSSSPHISKKEKKKRTSKNSNHRYKPIQRNSFENKTEENIYNDKNNRFRNTNYINLKKDPNKSSTIMKDKNVNVFFINIKNIINSKNEDNTNTKRSHKNKNYLESSVTYQRYRTPHETRELSESVKYKFLNQKTRITKIPWKIKKRALDEKIDVDNLYNNYMNKNKNPFKKNNNKLYNMKPIFNNNITNNKIYDNQSLFYMSNFKNIKYNYNKLQNDLNKKKDKINLKKYQNSITNKKNEMIKNINKKYNQLYTPQYTHKKSFFYNLNQKHLFPNKLFQSVNNNLYKENYKKLNKSYSYICDLSCIFFKNENLDDCYKNLINKLVNKNIYCMQKSSKAIRCFKNGTSCEIEIVKMEETNDKNDENNCYCFKIMGKSGCNIDKLFTNIVLE